MRFTILTPVFNPDPEDLRSMIESVKAQSWHDWELCLADDCSQDSAVIKLLKYYQRSDSRIKVLFRPERGHISTASNSAFDMATGDFISLVDHDDTVEPDSLSMAAKCINSVHDCDMVYSDEDSILPDGTHGTPYYKPSWSPDLLLSNMYTCHLSFYRRNIFEDIGGFRQGFEGSQDYDLALRFSEKARSICHIPKVLYHWRCSAASTALDLSNKAYAFEAGRRALQEAVDRRIDNNKHLYGTVEDVKGFPGHYRVKYQLNGEQKVKVGIMLGGGKSRVERTALLIRGIRENTKFKYSKKIFCFDSLEKCLFSNTLFDIDCDLFIFINCDLITPPDRASLDELVVHSLRSSVGAVSGLWTDSSGMVYHAGVVLDEKVGWRYSHKGYKFRNPGYMGRLLDIANCISIAPACFALSAEKLRMIGGFDKCMGGSSVIDLCIKLYFSGYYNVVTPSATFKVRNRYKLKVFSEEGKALFMERWSFLLDKDPFYHPEIAAKGYF